MVSAVGNCISRTNAICTCVPAPLMMHHPQPPAAARGHDPLQALCTPMLQSLQARAAPGKAPGGKGGKAAPPPPPPPPPPEEEEFEEGEMEDYDPMEDLSAFGRRRVLVSKRGACRIARRPAGPAHAWVGDAWRA